MGLNPKSIELNPKFGPAIIAPLSKWQNTPFFDDAADNAAEVFHKKGALLPVRFEEGGIIVVEYPYKGKLEFIFAKRIAGKDEFYRFVWNLDEDPKLIAHLRNIDAWPALVH